MADIVVVGSLNRDRLLQVERIPRAGETVLAEGAGSHRGGKGANQAVAAARLGASVAMVGKVGADADGTSYLRALVTEGIDVDAVTVDIDAPTGEAFILLAGDAENAIVVVPGANAALTAADVSGAATALENAAVVLLQLEIPMEAVKAAAQLAGGVVILNPAPAGDVGSQLLTHVDVVVPNRGELALLVGGDEATDLDGVVAQAQQLARPDLAVVVTMGADGALLVADGVPVHVAPPEVVPVDTTGAGDAFCGGLAEALARGEGLEASVRRAVRVGALATTRVGAQTGFPTRDDLTGLP
jgi:ribokinase